MSSGHSSVCRICTSGCGVRVFIDHEERLEKVIGDRDHPLTQGHACFKGLQSPATHNSPERILHAQKRLADGRFQSLPVEDALDEIAERVADIAAKYGPDAIGTFAGQPAFLNAATMPMMEAFRSALGTSSHYTSATIDQPGKYVVAERMGYWHAGKTPLAKSDVLMLIGTNPLVSFQCPPVLTTDPVKTLKRAKARGLKLVVIDPRRTETAEHADIFLQPRVGEDVTLMAGLLRLILEAGQQDDEFCKAHVEPGHVQRLRSAVAAYDPRYVRDRAGVDPSLLEAAARTFVEARTGGAVSGTGPAMARHSSLAEHLVEALNVVCGRFPRAGWTLTDIVPWREMEDRHAEVVASATSWDALGSDAFPQVDTLFGEKLTGKLANTILSPGPSQVRALINCSGNLAANVPDQVKMVKGLKSLDLLVSIEPFFSNTARLSHYVLAPKLQYEREDLPLSGYGVSFQPVPWGQYLPAISAPPTGSDLVDDWYPFWALSKRLGYGLTYCDEPISMERTPSTDELLQLLCRSSAVPLDEIKTYAEGGKVFDLELTVKPARPCAGRFRLAPEDVCRDLMLVLREPWQASSHHVESGRKFTHVLSIRRARDLMNSQGLYTASVRKRAPYNPACLAPDDMTDLGLVDGEIVAMVSATGAIDVVVQGDISVQPGVVTLSHSWGGLPDDESEEPTLLGSSVNRIIGSEEVDPYTAQAVMTGLPIYLEKKGPDVGAALKNARRRVPN